MTDHEQEGARIAGVADHLVPQLKERLTRHGLGEIEVALGELRLRVTASAASVPPPASSTGAPGVTGGRRDGDRSGRANAAGAGREDGHGGTTLVPVASPAVGFFVYADGLGPGLGVTKGDPLGHVEMLGVRHDVRAPRGGTVSHLVAESGEAVEYGQVVVEIEPAEARR